MSGARGKTTLCTSPCVGWLAHTLPLVRLCVEMAPSTSRQLRDRYGETKKTSCEIDACHAYMGTGTRTLHIRTYVFLFALQTQKRGVIPTIYPNASDKKTHPLSSAPKQQ